MTVLKNNKSVHKRWLVLIVVALAVITAQLWVNYSFNSSTDEVKQQAPEPISYPIDSATKSQETDWTAWNQAVVEEQQKTAFKAAAELQTYQEITGPLNKRPEFVSPFEWQVLKQVSGSEQALVDMVNHLRFAKQEEIWEILADANEEPEKRHAIAEQLLQNIPGRVKKGQMTRDLAHKLQIDLLSDLISDPDERRDRMSEEASRIGITFDVQKTPLQP